MTYDHIKIAHAFRNEMREALPNETLIRIDMQNFNSGFDPSICYSGDYCDSNEVMLAAWESLGFEWDCESQEQADAVNKAWWHVKTSGFALRELGDVSAIDRHGDPCTRFGFTMADGMDIHDPFTSECGRFEIDPIAYYGLIAEQVSQFGANAPRSMRY